MNEKMPLRKIVRWACIAVATVSAALWTLTIPIVSRDRALAMRWAITPRWSLRASMGAIILWHDVDLTRVPRNRSFVHISQVTEPPPGKFGFWLPGVYRWRGKHSAYDFLSIPCWTFLGASLTTIGLVSFFSRRRRSPNHCPNCNYNLTANESGTCPECGTPTTKSELAMQEPTPIIRTRSASLGVAVATAGQDRVSLRDNSAKSSDDFR